MRSIVLKMDYSSLDKPVALLDRTHDLGGTDYDLICRLTIDHAKMLNENHKIGWLFGEPDWSKHYHKMELFQAKRDLELAKKRVEDLENK